MTTETKLCTKCKQIKPISEFSTMTSRGKKQIGSYCKPCKCEYNRVNHKPHAATINGAVRKKRYSPESTLDNAMAMKFLTSPRLVKIERETRKA